MPRVSSPLYYAAPLTPAGRADDWCIDAVTRPPEVLFNFRKVGVETLIEDLREGALRPSLDETGFEKADAESTVDHRDLLDNDETALEAYRKETGELLKALTGADAVEFFDATLRRQDASGDPAAQSPHQRVHVDQSPRSALARALNRRAPGEFRRFQIINVWRPLLEPVRNFPLALCDFRSLDLVADLVPTRLDFPDWLKDRENYSVRHNPKHRWYHWDSLTPDEALVFKCHDSASRALASVGGETASGELLDVAGLCPHTAFYDHNGPSTGHLRTSLELRALAFHE
ncbi:CmcJ/NvfI family oxidoreductase [Amycolatopsis albispora]|uniref:7-alpha-cephem-methoxylase n=1 Tax=Amycolatopsis albispora TaxID=1804986 RepID=A0A344L0S9_9PSEU|nr:CmcJ/NvfI family oxidoreductase [Amycolatopsis albispora]AXB41653.1 7-alpha-cephem-methoxylase [Amycolatopsis albispora]